ncbi:MAG TPA: hypothetical protein VFV34_20290, partial [Blastocatellia bacterium]|nr:hypothetical protein [Blastocatellia bacterium]
PLLLIPPLVITEPESPGSYTTSRKGDQNRLKPVLRVIENAKLPEPRATSGAKSRTGFSLFNTAVVNTAVVNTAVGNN